MVELFELTKIMHATKEKENQHEIKNNKLTSSTALQSTKLRNRKIQKGMHLEKRTQWVYL